MKNIFITWGCGFIWSHLLKRLIKDDCHVFCLVKRTSNLYRINDLLDNNNLQLVYSENIKDLEEIFINNKIDCIFHLATTYKKAHEISDIDAMVDTNIKLWTYLCQFAAKYWVKIFINTWTFFEYKHYKDKENILSETSEEFPYNLYASTKLSFHNILKYYTSNYDIKAVTLRLFSPYWPIDNLKIIPLLIKNILYWEEELKLSWWEQKLCFTYVDDIVDAYVKCLEKLDSFNNKYEVFNVWADNVTSLKNVYEILCEISNKEWNVKFWAFPYAQNEIFHSQCDNKKAKILLEREPRTSIKDWLSLTYNSYLNDFWKD